MRQRVERSAHVSKRNIVWLVVIVAIGVVGWLAFGVVPGLLAAVVALVVSEIVERRERAKRRASRGAS